MTEKQRKYLACIVGIESWLNGAPIGSRIKEAFEDEGEKATESEISCGLEAARMFRISPDGVTKERVATNCASY